jgi:Uma2 family endonuclease
VARLTLEDFERFPEDDLLTHEIIDGVHYTQRGRSIRHQEVLGNLMTSMRPERHNGVLLHVVGVVLSPHDVLVPDVVYITPERQSIVTRRYIEGAPDLIVEVLEDDDTRLVDEVLKRHCYARFGVGEYWMIDPETDSIRINGVEVKSDVITTPAYPGLTLQRADVFARW